MTTTYTWKLQTDLLPMNSPFHLAFPVHDLEAARSFYCDVLGCRIGRESGRWIDFEFFGHQITAHLSETAMEDNTNRVDGDSVPVRHFGVILEWGAWQVLRDRLEARGFTFLIPPRVRFKGEVGEQATMFLLDPSANALEFKSFQNQDQIFARE